MNVLDIVTVTVAVYGAALSTYNLVQASRRDKVRAHVEVATMMYVLPGRKLGETMISITVSNRGVRPLVANLPALIIPTGEQLILMDADGAGSFPARLEDGAAANVRISYEDVAEALSSKGLRGRVNLIGRCNVQTGERFNSKRWTFDITSWRKKRD